MNDFKSFARLAARLLQYECYRLGLAQRPTLRDIAPQCLTALERIYRWPERIRTIGREHCPATGPAVFVANHIKLLDPLIAFREIYQSSHGAIAPYAMMRDDFFQGSWLKTRLWDIDEIAEIAGGIPISRDNVRLSQLKPFVQLLLNEDAFVMYPGRSRTRTGLFLEYREGIDEPGSAAFFIAQAQRARPGRPPIPAVPLARTYNPVTTRSAMIFGPPMYLDQGARREAQRAFDFALIERLGSLVEINLAQMVSALLYLQCLHARPLTITRESLASNAGAILNDLPHPYIDPAAQESPAREIDLTLQFLAVRGYISLTAQNLQLDRAKILHNPDHDNHYRKNNPLRYMANQILHIEPLVERLNNSMS